MMRRKEEFLNAMGKMKKNRGYDMILLMLTDVLLEGTRLLYLGDEQSIRQAFNCKVADNTVFLPQVMSRKKQVIPALSALWG